MMLQLEMEELVLVSEELEPYVLEIQPGPEIDGVVDCFTLAVMRRADGVLLAMPAEALPQEVVDAGNREDSTGIFGPSTVVTVPGVVQNNGVVGPTGQDLPVLLIDCGRGVSAFLRQPEIGEEMTFGFDEDRPHALPSPDGIVVSGFSVGRLGVRSPKFLHCRVRGRRGCGSGAGSSTSAKEAAKKAWSRGGYSFRKGRGKTKTYDHSSIGFVDGGSDVGNSKVDRSTSDFGGETASCGGSFSGGPSSSSSSTCKTFGRDLQHSSEVKPRFFGKGNVPCSSNSAAAGYGNSGSFDSEACNSARVGGREDEGGFRSNKPSTSSSRSKPGLDHFGVADSSSRTRPNGRPGWLGVKHFNSGCTRSSSSTSRIGQASGDFLPSSSSTDGPPDGSNFSGRGDPGRVGGERNHRDPLLGEVRWLRSFEGVGPASVSGHDGLGLSDARQHPCRQGHHCVGWR